MRTKYFAEYEKKVGNGENDAGNWGQIDLVMHLTSLTSIISSIKRPIFVPINQIIGVCSYFVMATLVQFSPSYLIYLMFKSKENGFMM